MKDFLRYSASSVAALVLPLAAGAQSFSDTVKEAQACVINIGECDTRGCFIEFENKSAVARNHTEASMEFLSVCKRVGNVTGCLVDKGLDVQIDSSFLHDHTTKKTIDETRISLDHYASFRGLVEDTAAQCKNLRRPSS